MATALTGRGRAAGFGHCSGFLFEFLHGKSGYEPADARCIFRACSRLEIITRA
jgi:hypothetical protein